MTVFLKELSTLSFKDAETFYYLIFNYNYTSLRFYCDKSERELKSKYCNKTVLKEGSLLPFVININSATKWPLKRN